VKFEFLWEGSVCSLESFLGRKSPSIHFLGHSDSSYIASKNPALTFPRAASALRCRRDHLIFFYILWWRKDWLLDALFK